MRKRIQQLARGKFEYARPLLELSTDKIEIEVLEGKDYTGDFIITSANHVPVRGTVETSDQRMECLTPQFEGEEVRIRYQFHTEGLLEGDVLTGKFFLICNQGEYDLSFVVSVSRLYADSSIGKIRTLGEFTKLAEVSPSEAVRLFDSPNFKNILKEEETKERLLYEGLCKNHFAERALEEFLLGCGRKQPVTLSLGKSEASFEEVTQTRKERIELSKDTWGCVDAEVSSDAVFLRPAKSALTGDSFIGNTCLLEYYIDAEKLHGGRNYGCIHIVLPGQTLEFRVCARSDREPAEQKESIHMERERLSAELVNCYIEYRLKRVVTGVWANQTIERLDHLAAMDASEPMYDLMKAQAFIVNRQRQEAVWILEDFKRQWKDTDAPIWGYYLYLNTLLEREPSYVDRMGEEVEELYRRHSESGLLFWILLFLKEEYCMDGAKRFKAIEQFMRSEGEQSGKASPYLYLEAYYLIWQDPYLLTRLTPFAVGLLNWAVRHEALTKEIALQVISLLDAKKEFDPCLYRVLNACCKVDESEETLAAVCAYLIRSQCYERRYHVWYARAIEQEIRLTGLYEAYLLTMDSHAVSEVPRVLQMYFQYNSALSYRQKAVLYVNIIAGKERQPEVYRKYARSMEQFALEQLEAGHMDDNLAVLYRELLGHGILNEEIASHLADVLFMHKFVCLDSRAARVFVWEYALKEGRVVTLTGGEAYFPVYTEDVCILVEDAYGRRFTDGSISWQLEPLMNPSECIDRCMELAPEKLPFLLYHFRKKKSWEQFDETEKKELSKLLESPQVSDRLKASWCLLMLQFYKNDTGREHTFSVEPYLKEAEFEILPEQTRRYLLNLLVETRLYEKAYQMVRLYGYEKLELSCRVALCGYEIAEMGYEEDDFLLGFVQSTFLLGKYSDVMLIYLCKYYNGPTKRMEKLWRAAGEFDIDTFDLEERILTQMLYTTDFIGDAGAIYDSYCAGGGRELVCMAYLSYFANCYLTRDMVIPDNVFLQIEQLLQKNAVLNDACRIGFLKYLSAGKEWSDTRLQIAEQILAECIGKNRLFSFFKQLDTRLVNQFQLYDKFFIEYHANAGAQVRIRYSLEGGEYREEELSEVYDGIFVRQFVLFFGETLQYYILEGEGMKEQVTKSGTLENHDVPGKQAQGKYEMLNEMLMSVTLQDEAGLKRLMKKYYGYCHAAGEVFKPL